MHALLDKNTKQFWTHVRNQKKCPKKESIRIDKLTDPDKIVKLFSEKFRSIFNDSKCQSDKLHVNHKYDEVTTSKNIRYFPTNIINNAIISLNPQIDHDNLHVNHFKLGPDSLKTFLSKLYSICYRHSFLPEEILRGVLIPLVKDEFGDVESSSNYRPIISSSIFF